MNAGRLSTLSASSMRKRRKTSDARRAPAQPDEHRRFAHEHRHEPVRTRITKRQARVVSGRRRTHQEGAEDAGAGYRVLVPDIYKGKVGVEAEEAA